MNKLIQQNQEQLWYRDINLCLRGLTPAQLQDFNLTRDLAFYESTYQLTLARIEQIKQMQVLRSQSTEMKLDFYHSIRAQDHHTASIEGEMIHELRRITHRDGINVGSFGLGLNITSSDIDLGIGVVNWDDFYTIAAALADHGFEYKEARGSRFISPTQRTFRFVFFKSIHDIDVDIAVYHWEDLALLATGNARCREAMSIMDKATHTWNKFQLKTSGMLAEYSVYKLEPYIRFKPGFDWIAV